ncbi:type I pantothenate kinase [Vibrio gallicus]|uniref:type I pantothenate kinase n=1 Tax=Vibrio gallicus TaxID=190897 RepID=UPI0021C3FB0A|nr:type I pantothenate kinase [Vibrio gallicus]
MNSHIIFNRSKWSELRASVPMVLSDSDIEELRGINENMDTTEVEQIYLPLSRLLNLHVGSQQRKTEVLDTFLNKTNTHTPFVIGIAGSVAVGKSTTARLLKALLSRWENHPKVELVTTDGFLYPKKVLDERGIMHRKGFPESYDIRRLIQFVSDVKAAESNIEVPVYSHITYDITEEKQIINRPDVLIIEGLNVLQSGMDYPHDPLRIFVSDFLDFSIYVDAKTDVIEQWYIDRFLKFRSGAFTKPNSYFSHYTQLTEQQAVDKARNIWREINGVNLSQNILPTKNKANLILHKGKNHQVEQIWLRS